MNKITSKSNVLFAINENRKNFDFVSAMSNKEITTYINTHKRAFKEYYNSVIKCKLGKGKDDV